MSKLPLGETLQTFQITDPSLYATDRAHELWSSMRGSNPVMWVEPTPQHDGFWAVTGYTPGLAALTNWAVFASGRGTMLRPSMTDPAPGAGSMLVLTDPPKHGAIRDVLFHHFTPGAVLALESTTRQLVGHRLDEVIGAGPFDFMTDVAEGLVLSVCSAILGIPSQDREMVAGMVKAVESSIRGASGDAGYADHISIVDYFQGLIASNPNDNSVLVPLVALAADESSGVTINDVVLTCDNLIVAAGESTMQAAASGLLALHDSPSQWRLLRDGDASFKRAVQETLRWASPAVHLLRTTTTATTLAGVAIPAGSPVTVWLPSMNRDETEFVRGDEFDVTRWPNRHAAFGGGSHFCLGASLSRLVLRVLFEEIVKRAEKLTLVGAPQRLASCYLNGFDSLPISISS